MKKSEMEAHFLQYQECCAQIEQSLARRPFDVSVLSRCCQTFEHIVPTLRLLTRNDPEFSVSAIIPIVVIDRFGPPLFAREEIAAFSDFVESSRYLKKPDFGLVEMASFLSERERDAMRLWNHIGRNPFKVEEHVLSDLEIDCDSGKNTLDIWEELGIVHRVYCGDSRQLRLGTDLSESVTGVCPSCGVRGNAKRETFYRQHTCRRCDQKVLYHIVSD